MSKDTNNDVPLYVDLDGTLIAGDLLFEAIVLLCRNNLFYLLMIPLWLLRGKSQLKQEVFSRVTPDVEILPYNPDFMAFLNTEHERKRTLVLATASNEIVGRKVSDHLGIFSDVIASDSEQNLKGEAKAMAIVQHRTSLGQGEAFAYAGNESADIPIWRGPPSKSRSIAVPDFEKRWHQNFLKFNFLTKKNTE